MTLTQKETSLLKDLKSQEQLCVEKYNKYAADARNPQLKTIFSEIAQAEQQHLQTITQMEGGTVPQMGGGASSRKTAPSAQNNYAEQDKQKDKFLCQDLLTTEKHVSSLYDTSIFEFRDVGMRNALNHVQKEEQEHGEQIYSFMSLNGMYS
jgi:spore coat protein CotF